MIVLLLVYPLIHVLAAIALTLIVCTLHLPIVNIFKKNFVTQNFTSKEWFIVSLISSIWIITWTSSFYLWQAMVRNINLLINEGGATELQKISGISINAGTLGYNVYSYFILIYGPFIILSFISVVVFLNLIKIRSKYRNDCLLSLFGPFIAFAILIAVLFLVNLEFGPMRFQFYMTIIGIICCSHLVLLITHNQKRWKSIIGNIVSIGIVVIIFLSSIAVIYPSPLTYSDNYQTTQSDVSGMKWFFSERDIDQNISGISVAPGRYADLLFNSVDSKNQHVSLYLDRDYVMTYHFGYDKNNNIELGNNITDSYLIITDTDKFRYQYVLPEILDLRYTQSDYAKLSTDSTVDKIFIANEFEIYLVG
jgi:hypothetical protein